MVSFAGQLPVKSGMRLLPADATLLIEFHVSAPGLECDCRIGLNGRGDLSANRRSCHRRRQPETAGLTHFPPDFVMQNDQFTGVFRRAAGGQFRL